MTTTTHVIQFSGGIGSWAAARRVADQHGTKNLVLLFADILTEDPDTYRFNVDAANDLDVSITRVCDGRTPQQLLRKKRWLGSSRIAPCSHLLKQKVCRDWLQKNTNPATTILYVGIDWSEIHRFPAIQRNWAPWQVEAPLTKPPYMDKHAMIQAARDRGLMEPRLYGMGFPHNNCQGACVRAGQAQWTQLLRVFPDLFASWEEFETEMRAELKSDISILRQQVDGETRPLTLAKLRTRVETASKTQPEIDFEDWGGCGCMVETE